MDQVEFKHNVLATFLNYYYWFPLHQTSKCCIDFRFSFKLISRFFFTISNNCIISLTKPVGPDKYFSSFHFAILAWLLGYGAMVSKALTETRGSFSMNRPWACAIFQIIAQMIAQLATPSRIVSSFLLALGNRLQPGFLSLPLGRSGGRVTSVASCPLVGPLPTISCFPACLLPALPTRPFTSLYLIFRPACLSP